MTWHVMVSRAEFLELAAEGTLAKVKWTKLAEAVYGEPLYKRIRRYRRDRR